jgi:hypothetical protein
MFIRHVVEDAPFKHPGRGAKGAARIECAHQSFKNGAGSTCPRYRFEEPSVSIIVPLPPPTAASRPHLVDAAHFPTA